MVGLIIGVLIYLVSVWGAYKFFQLSHYHPKGEYYGDTPIAALLLFILVPLMNSVVTISLLLGIWRKDWSINISFLLKPKHNKWDSKERL